MTDEARERRDHAMIMLFAARYAMPRQSAGVGIVIDYITRHMESLTMAERTRLASEIGQEQVAGRLGDPRIDEPRWLALRDALRGGE